MAEGESARFVAPKLTTKEMSAELIPIPDDPVDCSEENDRRLWIGNLDTRVTEFALLKILQKFGSLQRFDFLYHKTGPDQGKPRGYCFVSYSTKQEAEKAKKSLDRKLALSKRMVVRWAHKEGEREPEKYGEKGRTAEESAGNISSEYKIRAIEMKLKKMERNEPEFSLNTKPAAVPGSSKYSSVNNDTSQGARPNQKNSGASQRLNSKPYQKRDSNR